MTTCEAVTGLLMADSVVFSERENISEKVKIIQKQISRTERINLAKTILIDIEQVYVCLRDFAAG